MKIEYKKVKIVKPHCPECKEMLTGNNSFVLPYQCSCGVWKLKDNLIDYEIISNK